MTNLTNVFERERLRVILSANAAMVLFYWDMGRTILALQIDNQAHRRTGKAVTNFLRTLPPGDSDMAAQAFKDPYLFDFLGTADPRREAGVEEIGRAPAAIGKYKALGYP